MRRFFPDLKIEAENIIDLLNNEILKREVLDGDKVKDAQQRIKKAISRNAKAQQKRVDAQIRESAAEPAPD